MLKKFTSLTIITLSLSLSSLFYTNGALGNPNSLNDNSYISIEEVTSFKAKLGPNFINAKRVVFLNEASEIVLMNPITQTVQWKTKIKKDDLPSSIDNISSLLNENIIFSSFGNVIYAISYKDGKILWRTKLKSTTRSKVTLQKNLLLVTTTDESLYALSKKSGKEIWNIHSSLPEIQKIRSIGTSVSKSEQIATILSKNIIYILTNSGSEVWSKILPNFEASFTPVIHDNLLIVFGNPEQVTAYNIESGKKIWTSSTEAYSQPKIINKNQLFIQTKSGIKVLSAKTGKILEKYSLTNIANSGILNTVLFADKLDSSSFFFILDNNTSFVLDRKTKKITISKRIQSKNIESISSNHNIFCVKSDNNFVSCLTINGF